MQKIKKSQRERKLKWKGKTQDRKRDKHRKKRTIKKYEEMFFYYRSVFFFKKKIKTWALIPRFVCNKNKYFSIF